MKIDTTHVRETVRASVEAQLGRGMSSETADLLDTICRAVDDGSDLVALHHLLGNLHRAMLAVHEGDIDVDRIEAALRMTMTAVEKGEDAIEALERHLGPLLPQQEVCL